NGTSSSAASRFPTVDLPAPSGPMTITRRGLPPAPAARVLPGRPMLPTIGGSFPRVQEPGAAHAGSAGSSLRAAPPSPPILPPPRVAPRAGPPLRFHPDQRLRRRTPPDGRLVR